MTMLAVMALAADYPRPDLLVEPAALAPGFVVLDARPRARYDAGHVPGARWVDHAEWAKGFGDGRDAANWGKRLGGLGLSPADKVVVYDDNLARDAARVWWLLRYWGVADVRLLNGGWAGWQAGKFPVSADRPAVSPTAFPATAAPDRLATKADMLAVVRGGKVQVVDARSDGEFCGTDKLTNKRAGAMPGAKQLEWSDLLDKPTQRFKPAAELAKLFAAAGIDPTKPTATHCQSGGRASVMAFGLELMGATDVRNYYASWGEWGNADDTPVVTPPRK
jgi:thiosulfate/3-mercaptopyruvate sulfurtransferase